MLAARVKKDAQLTIRLSSETKAAIGKAADELDRPRNWLVVHVLEAWLKKRRRRK
jgi:predicted transcriptional regulator